MLIRVKVWNLSFSQSLYYEVKQTETYLQHLFSPFLLEPPYICSCALCNAQSQKRSKKVLMLKGQSNKIFDLQFFSSIKPALATGQWVKIFSNLVKNSQSCSNFKSKNPTPQGIIPQRVRLPGVSYPGKSISPGYHTPGSQSPRGIIPQRVTFFDTKVLISQQNLN